MTKMQIETPNGWIDVADSSGQPRMFKDDAEAIRWRMVHLGIGSSRYTRLAETKREVHDMMNEKVTGR
ncbi:MAG: hypothetical protein EHM12_10935 [Dehalococcoidia bacterium]|nr:MAG: hypothetical protein EHM12_10935 [Dehalococcoidia bacterium]